MESAQPLGIIACDVLEDEVRSRTASLGLEPLELRFLEMGKHDFPDGLHADLQEVVDILEAKGCRRLVFVYGLCSNSILGLKARRAEMIFPRAHDCITLFLGSRERYAQIQKDCPGTYWFSPGWCRGKRVPGPGHFEELEARYREQFDEDEVDYLMDMERQKLAHYSVAAYTDLGDGPVEECKAATREAAELLGMEYRHHEGEDGLLVRLLAGPWEEKEFVVVPPGKTLAQSVDECVIKCVDCPVDGAES